MRRSGGPGTCCSRQAVVPAHRRQLHQQAGVPHRQLSLSKELPLDIAGGVRSLLRKQKPEAVLVSAACRCAVSVACWMPSMIPGFGCMLLLGIGVMGHQLDTRLRLHVDTQLLVRLIPAFGCMLILSFGYMLILVLGCTWIHSAAC